MAKRNPAWGKSYSPVGRVNRKEYLISSVCLAIYTGLVLGIGSATSTFVALRLGAFSGIAIAGLSILLAAYLYWQYLMICVKRWHDLNLSGWMCLITLMFSIFPFFYLILLVLGQLELFVSLAFIEEYARWGLILLFLFQLFVKGTKGPNKYGPDPLEQE